MVEKDEPSIVEEWLPALPKPLKPAIDVTKKPSASKTYIVINDVLVPIEDIRDAYAENVARDIKSTDDIEDYWYG